MREPGRTEVAVEGALVHGLGLSPSLFEDRERHVGDSQLSERRADLRAARSGMTLVLEDDHRSDVAQNRSRYARLDAREVVLHEEVRLVRDAADERDVDPPVLE